MDNHFVYESPGQSLTYGTRVYQVWSHAVRYEDRYPQILKYETSSKTKAEAVAEYLNKVSEQADLDQYRIPEIQGTFTPRSIN